MKKYLTLLLLSLLPLVASAYDAKIDGIYYNLNKNNKTASVTYKELDNGNPVNDCSGDIVIPGEVTYEDVTYKVTAIEEKAFYNCSALTSVTIPGSVKSIGVSAFYNCEFLISVNIPEGITIIRDKTFQYCSSLNSVFIPNSVKFINSNAFQECVKLRSVFIPNSVKSIGDEVFSKCEALMSVIIPNSVEVIGKKAFYRCENLNFVSLGSGIQTIGDEAFGSCASLNTLHLLATTPPSSPNVHPDAFNGTDVTSDFFYFYYPKGTWSEYVNAEPWYTFHGSNLNEEYYGKESHTLTITMNDEPYTTFELFPDATIELLPSPYKEGYTFDGWINTLPAMQDKDCTFNAKFTPNKYKLTYKIDGETVYSDDVEYGTELTQTSPYAAAEKEGYKFSGWVGLPETMPAHDVEVTGTYTIQKYKLKYILDGKEYKTYEIEYGATITPEADPEKKEGYTFSGWTGIPDKMPANDVEVTGSYTVLEYKLTYKIEGEDDHIETVAFGTKLTQTSPYAAPEKEGYEFSGWQGLPETMPANDVEVTGSYTVLNYKLTYKIAGEEDHIEEVAFGTKLTQTSPYAAPEKEGYKFDGWVGLPETMPAKDVEVTGSYTVLKFKLTYIVDDKTYKEFEVEYGATITPEADPEKEGYTFSGWSEIPGTMPAEDVNVYGVFSINTYKLTYMVDGEEYQTMKLVYGSEIPPMEEPKKIGYTFSGWSEIPETMPAQDVVVTGTFTINSYKLTYKVDGEPDHIEEVVFGTELTQTSPYAAPEKEGYKFDEWLGLPETMPAQNLEVTAAYTVMKFKLTYMVGDEIYSESEVEYGATITPVESPKKDGYQFSGWQDLPETMPAHDVIVSGYFSPATYKLRYYVNGELYDEYDIAFGNSTDVFVLEPYKEDYVFSGWSEIPETMPAHDVEVTGRLVRIGDANGDGVLNIADIIQIYNYISGHPSKDFLKYAADVTYPEEIDEDDIIVLVNKIMNLQ